jgi:hypothetical protein
VPPAVSRYGVPGTRLKLFPEGSLVVVQWAFLYKGDCLAEKHRLYRFPYSLETLFGGTDGSASWSQTL